MRSGMGGFFKGILFIITMSSRIFSHANVRQNSQDMNSNLNLLANTAIQGSNRSDSSKLLAFRGRAKLPVPSPSATGPVNLVTPLSCKGILQSGAKTGTPSASVRPKAGGAKPSTPSASVGVKQGEKPVAPKPLSANPVAPNPGSKTNDTIIIKDFVTKPVAAKHGNTPKSNPVKHVKEEDEEEKPKTAVVSSSDENENDAEPKQKQSRPVVSSSDEDEPADVNKDTPDPFPFTPIKKGRLLMGRLAATKHAKTHHCTKCDRSFVDKRGLRSHMDKHENNRFICKYCTKVSYTRASHANHRRTHYRLSKERTEVTCDTCHKTFESAGRLRQHSVVHTKGKNYRQKGNHDMHVLYIHNPEGVKLPEVRCEWCGKQFKLPVTMRSHRRQVHLGQMVAEASNRKVSTFRS